MEHLHVPEDIMGLDEHVVGATETARDIVFEETVRCVELTTGSSPIVAIKTSLPNGIYAVLAEVSAYSESGRTEGKSANVYFDMSSKSIYSPGYLSSESATALTASSSVYANCSLEGAAGISKALMIGSSRLEQMRFTRSMPIASMDGKSVDVIKARITFRKII